MFQIAKCRANTWKTAAIKGSKSFKHLVLISLSDIRSLIEMSSFNLDGSFLLFSSNLCFFFVFLAAEQFGILCSVDGQLRQLVFRVTNKNLQSRTDLIDQLAKAISDDRCLLDKVFSSNRTRDVERIDLCFLFQSSLIQHSTNDQQLYSSQTSLENSEIDSSTRSTSSLNLLGLALKRYGREKRRFSSLFDFDFSGLHKANKRLTRAFSFSPESNRYLTKKLLSPLHYLQDEWSHSFDTSQRMNNSSRQVNRSMLLLLLQNQSIMFRLGIVFNDNELIIALYAIDSRTSVLFSLLHLLDIFVSFRLMKIFFRPSFMSDRLLLLLFLFFFVHSSCFTSCSFIFGSLLRPIENFLSDIDDESTKVRIVSSIVSAFRVLYERQRTINRKSMTQFVTHVTSLHQLKTENLEDAHSSRTNLIFRSWQQQIRQTK